ncbi:MAG: hypothetical protein Q9220_004743 [cf. Caloplaca sp. 1 TL-2023]
MNCPSRTDEADEPRGWNQNPPGLSADLTTRADLNGIANLRTHREHDLLSQSPIEMDGWVDPDEPASGRQIRFAVGSSHVAEDSKGSSDRTTAASDHTANSYQRKDRPTKLVSSWIYGLGKTLIKFTKFIGPGFMVAVAYIDPGNYSTDVAAGAATRFKLLGQTQLLRFEDTLEADRKIQVIGSAIALNLLLKIPLVGGCALTLVDVLIILIFYSPDGSMRRLRAFECFVMCLVLGVVICFCVQLSYIQHTGIGEVFRGYVPSSAVVEGEGVFLSCGILGATVMPHSLYLGSGMVQSRLRHYDESAGNLPRRASDAASDNEKTVYRPSLAAIHSCLTHSTVEVALSLFTFALFVNSAILIVSGASLSSNSAAGSADLFGIHDLLSKTLAPAAGTIFALALLLSGTSAGIVCTIAGQMLSEGALNWSIAPWLRRLITRSISITPSIIIAGAVGKDGLSAALNGTQVALSVALPFVSAPLIYFTCRKQYMVVGGPKTRDEDDERPTVNQVQMRNHWAVSVFAVLVWLVIAVMNVALLVIVGMGKA